MMASKYLHIVKSFIAESIRYPGLTSMAQVIPVSKGYVDLGTIHQSIQLTDGIVNVLCRFLVSILEKSQNGTAFIRDPNDVISKYGVEKIKNRIPMDLAGLNYEMQSYSLEAEDDEGADMYGRLAQALEKSKVQITRKQGSDNSIAYQIIVSPKPNEVIKRFHKNK